jgi:uncharacterized membrane protein
MMGMTVIAVVLGLAVLLLPWIAIFRLARVERRLREAEARIARLFTELAALRATARSEAPEAAPAEAPDWAVLAASAPPAEEIAAGLETAEVPMLAPPPPAPAETPPPAPRPTFEQQFGVRLPVWLGGAALALAGFFLVKVSIERGWLSPPVRVILGLAFGAWLLYAADWMRRKDGTPNGFRIAQALSGSGITVLYASLFAATSLYELIPPLIGFAALAALTLAALVLSLRHGPAVALMAMVGGFLTPAFVHSGDPSAPGLFLYLYFLLAGVFVLIRQRNWWLLGLPSIAGAFLWVLIWVFAGNFRPGDTVYLGLFLLAVSATVVAASRREFEGEEEAGLAALLKPAYALNILTLSGALLLMGAVGYQSGFGTADWVFFGLLSAGAVSLAFFDQGLYGAVPWLAMAVNIAMLAGWSEGTAESFAVTCAAFGALFAVSGYVLRFRSPRPVLWAGLFCAASLGYFLLGYYELYGTPLVEGFSAFWGSLALALAAASTAAVARIIKKMPDDALSKQTLLAIFSGTATAFIALGLTIELKREFLSVAISGEMLALAWIGLWLEIKALRYYAALLAGVFAFLLLPQILLLIELAAIGLFETELRLQEGIPIIKWPLFQLGLPSLCFAGTAYLLRSRQDGRLIGALEIAAITLFGIMGYYLTRQAFHPEQNVLFAKTGFFERGVLTNAIFVYGLVCLWLGRHYARRAASLCGLVLSAAALFRIVYFDLVLYNPVWASQNVGEMPLLNSLILTFGFPIFWTRELASEAGALGKAWIKPYANMAALALAFLLVTFEVRQLFHGANLDAGETTNLEVYAYSLAWLLLSLALLFLGTLRGDHAIRIASLAIMILTAGKVFLYDASQLEGLMRVLSFLGLGLSLLGISWFYTRFVFHAPAAAGSGGDNNS